MLLQTSGTTGRPTIVFRDAASLDAVARGCVKAVGFSAADRVLGLVPLCHSYGVEHGLLAPLLAGSCVRLIDGFQLDPVRGALAEGGVTVLPAVPSVFEMLCRAGGGPATFPRLRAAYSAGAPLPPAVAEAFAAVRGAGRASLRGHGDRLGDVQRPRRRRLRPHPRRPADGGRGRPNP